MLEVFQVSGLPKFLRYTGITMNRTDPFYNERCWISLRSTKPTLLSFRRTIDIGYLVVPE